MEKKSLSILIFLATIIAITIPLAMLTSGAATDNFDTNVSVGNTAPVINWVNDSVGLSPNEGSTRIIQIQMNVTDDNGVSDINTSDCYMNLTKSGETTRTSNICYSTSNTSNTQWIECNITIYWYEKPGEWVITAYATDDAGSTDTNDTSNFTMGDADYIDVINASITFSGSPGDANVGPSNIIINNTGNQNYTGIDLTAQNLTGASSSDNIGASQFTVNITDGSGNGQSLSHNSAVSITSAVLNRGPGASGEEELFFYVDIPSGIANDEYSAGSNWLIDPTGN